MEYFNEMEVIFDSRSENEGFARVAVAAFMTQMDPVLEEVADVKTAVSEAVTNSIIHGYEGRTSGKITVWCGIEKDKKTILVTVKDHGIGIESLWSLHGAEVVALNIIASVIGYTSKSICNRQYGKSSSVLAGSLEATGNSFFGHKRTNTIVYANNTIGIIGQC